MSEELRNKLLDIYKDKRQWHKYITIDGEQYRFDPTYYVFRRRYIDHTGFSRSTPVACVVLDHLITLY